MYLKGKKRTKGHVISVHVIYKCKKRTIGHNISVNGKKRTIGHAISVKGKKRTIDHTEFYSVRSVVECPVL